MPCCAHALTQRLRSSHPRGSCVAPPRRHRHACSPTHWRSTLRASAPRPVSPTSGIASAPHSSLQPRQWPRRRVPRHHGPTVGPAPPAAPPVASPSRAPAPRPHCRPRSPHSPLRRQPRLHGPAGTRALSPTPPSRLRWASARFDTPLGPASSTGDPPRVAPSLVHCLVPTPIALSPTRTVPPQPRAEVVLASSRGEQGVQGRGGAPCPRA